MSREIKLVSVITVVILYSLEHTERRTLSNLTMIDVALSTHLDNFAEIGYFSIIIRFVAEFMARIIAENLLQNLTI